MKNVRFRGRFAENHMQFDCGSKNVKFAVRFES